MASIQRGDNNAKVINYMTRAWGRGRAENKILILIESLCS